MTSLKLYELANAYQALESLGESDDMPAELIRDTLDSLEGDLQEKAVSVAKFIRNLEAASEAIMVAANAMAGRASRIQKRADSISAYLLFNMQATGITRIECPEFVLAVQKNPEAVRIAEGVTLPDRFMVTPEPVARPDKGLLKAALKAGETIEGVWLEQGESLRIKV